MDPFAVLDGRRLVLDGGEGGCIAESGKTWVYAGTLHPPETSRQCTPHTSPRNAAAAVVVGAGAPAPLRVALKTWALGSRPCNELLAAELVLLRRLQHPNVVRAHGVVEPVPGRQCWLVMDLWSWTLDAVIRGQAAVAFDIGDGLRAARDMARGLDHAHSRRILHRDVALRNALVSPRPPSDGGGGKGEWGYRVCIADFGLSVDLTDTVAFVGKEAQGSRVDGPVRSMAPELLGWTEPPSWSAASDLWGFGVSLWAALARQQPYHNLGPARHVRSHVLDGGRLPELTPAVAVPESNAAAVTNFNIEINEGAGLATAAVAAVCVELSAVACSEVNSLLDACFAFDPGQRVSAARALEHLDRALA